MKFRMFTDASNGKNVAVNVDSVCYVRSNDENDFVEIAVSNGDYSITVKEDFFMVMSRLNTIAE